MHRPTPEALAASAALAHRNRGRNAQLRRLFVERTDVAHPTPLALMLRGGRGGHVRLKTYLSMLWLAAAPPHDVAYPARAWASLLDLPDPSGRGARRINDAIAWLEANEFVEVATQPGYPNRVTLLHESGTGRRYRVPGAVYNKGKAKGADASELAAHRYLQIPAAYWTSGWMCTLSGPATAMFLVLLAEQSGRGDDQELWFSPEAATLRYSLSADTRSVGLQELRRAGIVAVRRRAIASDVFDVQRYRNTYLLQTSRIADSAEVPEASEVSRNKSLTSVRADRSAKQRRSRKPRVKTSRVP
jgi:hypothetical protein